MALGVNEPFSSQWLHLFDRKMQNKTFIHIHTHTAVQKLGSVRFVMFFKEASFAHQGCIYLMKNTKINSNIVNYYCIIPFISN